MRRERPLPTLRAMDFLIPLVERHGLLLVWGNVFLAQAGLPVPVAPTLLVAGAFAARDHFSWSVLLAGAVAASLIADYVWYLAGARFGDRVIAHLYRVFSVPAARARQIEDAVARWGTVGIIFAKFIPGFALVAPPIAGMIRVRPTVFVTAAGLGAALWAGVPIAMGAYHERAIHEALAMAGRQADWIGVLAGAVILALVGRMGWKQRARGGYKAIQIDSDLTSADYVVGAGCQPGQNGVC